MSRGAFDVYIPDGGEYQFHIWPLAIFLGGLFVYSLFLLDRDTRGFKHVRRSFQYGCRRTLSQLSRTVRGRASFPFRLDRLPPELLHEIFLYACTDGGRTGCSLALVSRRIHTHCRAARFNSVTLATGSNWKLRCFLRELERARRAAAAEEGSVTPRVRHLCLLANARKQGRTRFKRSAEDGKWHPHTKYFSSEARKRIEVSHRDRHHTSVEALLRAVAGDLETLCLINQFRYELQPLHVGHRCFPRLRELWLGGADDTVFVFGDPAEESGSDLGLRPRRTPHFPVLSRLHANGGLINFHRWSMEAPALVSMRVTMCCLGLRESEQASLEVVMANAAWPHNPILLVGDPGHVLSGLRQDYYAQALHSRERLRETAARVVFVPYYAQQDVEEDVRDVALRRELGRGARHLDDDEELLWRDWLARIKPIHSKWGDGRFVRDFWARFSNDTALDRVRIVEEAGQHYVEPLIQWNRTA